MADMRITVSFLDEEDYKHAYDKDNTSDYIRELVRKDRLNTCGSLENRIIKMLEQALKSAPASNTNMIMSQKKEKALKNILGQ